MSSKKNVVISVYSPIGGQGVSLIASQVVHLFAKHGPSCLLDLNLDQSISIYYLGKDPQTEFRHSALSSDEETSKLSSFAINIEANYYAVGVPLLGYGHFAEDPEEAMKELLDQCKGEFNYTVIDLPHPFHVDITRKALAMSDLVLILIADTEYAARAALKLNQLIATGNSKLNSARVKIVLNNRTGSTDLALPKLLLGISAVISPIVHSQWSTISQNIAILLIAVFALVAPALQAIVLLVHQASQYRRGPKLLKEKHVSIFHEFPNDAKTCMWSISQSTFFPEHSRIAASLSVLCEKIRKELNLT